jgi:catechol 2,3-dioxygenase-like lactoylglutathione lyase family enzyme
MQIDHINIKAPPALLEEVRNFYCEVLGLEEGARPEFSSKGYWLYSAAGPIVHLSVADESPPAGAGGHLDHVAFRTSGLREFVTRLGDLGVDFHRAYVQELDLTQLFFSDPAGTGLEINFSGERAA